MELRELTVEFAKVIAGVAPETRVPTCPEWQVRDLVGHIGQGPRWAAEILRSGVPTPPQDPRDAEPGPPAGWAEWMLAGIDELLAAVAGATTVWTIVGPRPAEWWVRRLRADLVVHLADAALAADVPYEVDTELAVDAISEGLDLLATPGLATFPGSRTGTLALRPTAGDGWLLTRDGGHSWVRGDGAADTVLSGTPQDLLLVLMRRRPVDAVTVTGDHALLTELLTYSV